jgi:hypothetical protein
MSTQKSLALKLLPAVFGVSSMSVYLWRQGTATKDALLEPFTPARLRSWAKKNGREIVRQPEDVLAKYEKEAAKRAAGRPSSSDLATSKKAKLARSGSGKLAKLTNRQAAAKGLLREPRLRVVGGAAIRG